MIVNKFNVMCGETSPNEANSPLVVDANAVLALAGTDQRFQSTTRRDRQILQGCRYMQELKFATRLAFDRRPFFHRLVVEQPFRVFASERLDYSASIAFSGWHANHYGADFVGRCLAWRRFRVARNLAEHRALRPASGTMAPFAISPLVQDEQERIEGGTNLQDLGWIGRGARALVHRPARQVATIFKIDIRHM